MNNKPSANGHTETLAIDRGTDNGSFDAYEPVGRLTEIGGGIRVSWRGQASIVDRFWAKVNTSGPIPERYPELGPCWLWTACVVARYGQIGLGHPSTPGSKRWKAHRFSWELHNGPIPDGLEACHHCDVPLCVNPTHLFLGTHQENHLDAVRKGRKKAWGLQKLNADDVRVIRAQVARGLRHKDIAAAFGIARHSVGQIANRKTWAHLDAVIA